MGEKHKAMFLVTALQMSRMDKKTIEDFGIPGAVLMENAGRGATRILLSKFGNIQDKKIGIIAGSGNNGGDGFVIARYLAEKGIKVSVYILSYASKVKGDAALNLGLLSNLNVPVIEICDQKNFLQHKSAMLTSDIWVDAIFGTGLNSEITGFIKTIINFINNLGKPVFAIDLPSGLHPDNGQPLGTCIKANVTATFGYAKTGHMAYPGIEYCGSIEIVDIGIPDHIAKEVLPSVHLLTPEKISSYYRPRNSNAHKGTTGHLLVIAGSRGKTGAAALTSEAAIRSGAGLVTLGIPESVNTILETLIAEIMTIPLPETKEGSLSKSAFNILNSTMRSINCIATGPGLGTCMQTVALTHKVLCESKSPVVIDAEALNIVSKNINILTEIKVPTILTPHPKEMARLTGESIETIQNNRIKFAKDFAKKYNVHLILKGVRTIIAHPNGEVYINPTGNPSMASGGMGDVLTGMIAGFITQGYSPVESSHMGVYLHGAIADILSIEKGPVGIVASDIISDIPRIIALMAKKELASINNIGRWF